MVVLVLWEPVFVRSFVRELQLYILDFVYIGWLLLFGSHDASDTV